MTPARLKALLAVLPEAVRNGIAPAYLIGAETVAAEARRRLGDGGVALSRAGVAPADPAGGLTGSIAAEPASDGAILTVTNPRAVFLEYGTTRMAARPFLRPAVDATADDVRQILSDAFGQSAATVLKDQP